ncbi:SAM-dependent methyltransferase [Oceanirhabdus seepicola]|uniref:Methyltransferase domain-containing protein n=1 Tax=Oceanirhabdus seepicola TaxID=2828781 RepID=A0A9J6NYF5_9CLOT|nr:methyltransferase domain-containing protein [Oceanirhabdus seepicola]MCM1989084.1 methyltransferase domain-containing protein [Oceanirhabdus seepicola]
MKYSKKELQKELTLKQFPLSAKYDIEWINENEMGPNAIWLAEFLTDKINLKKGMRVLDLGCGKGLSSIFLAKEFGVQVWATDLWIGATENFKRINEQGIEDLVYPIHADAHDLPFANGFFDAIVSLDAYHYFGTNEMYLESLIRYLKPNGQIGIVVPSVNKEFNSKVPERLKPYWEPYLFTHHSPNWWKELWGRSETVTVQVADTMPNGYENWLKWDETLKEAGILKRSGDVEMLEADGGNFTWARIVANKK